MKKSAFGLAKFLTVMFLGLSAGLAWGAQLDGIGLDVEKPKLFQGRECFASIEVPAQDWEKAAALLTKRGTLVGFSTIDRVSGTDRTTIAYGIFTFAGDGEILKTLNASLEKNGLPQLRQVRKARVDLCWERFSVSYMINGQPYVVRLGRKFGYFPVGENGETPRKGLAMATEAWKDPYRFTEKYFAKHCEYYLGPAPLGLAGKQWMDTLSIRIATTELGQASQLIFAGRVFIRGSGQPFPLTGKYASPWED